MSQPPANPPTDPSTDPDAGLTDEQKEQKRLFKSWLSEGIRETVAEMRKEDEPPPPRTKNPNGDKPSLFHMMFGG